MPSRAPSLALSPRFHGDPNHFGHLEHRARGRGSGHRHDVQDVRELRGFSPVAISTAVLTTGVWIMSFKLGLPIIAVVLVGVTGQNTGGVVGAAVLGVVVMIVLGYSSGWCSAARPLPSGSAASVTVPSTGCCISCTSRRPTECATERPALPGRDH